MTRPLASAKVNRLLDAEVDLDRLRGGILGLLSLQLFDVSRVRGRGRVRARGRGRVRGRARGRVRGRGRSRAVSAVHG